MSQTFVDDSIEAQVREESAVEEVVATTLGYGE